MFILRFISLISRSRPPLHPDRRDPVPGGGPLPRRPVVLQRRERRLRGQSRARHLRLPDWRPETQVHHPGNGRCLEHAAAQPGRGHRVRRRAEQQALPPQPHAGIRLDESQQEVGGARHLQVEEQQPEGRQHLRPHRHDGPARTHQGAGNVKHLPYIFFIFSLISFSYIFFLTSFSLTLSLHALSLLFISLFILSLFF